MAELGIVIGPKGRGSNMQAIIRACQDRELQANVNVVISPKEDIDAVRAAREAGVQVAICSPDSPTYAQDLLSALKGCDLVCLAGFTRLLPHEIIQMFPNRILNIHPALLPSYGGKGMYGLRVHEAVLASADTESGCTVHLVTEQYDEGQIILQRKCPVLAGDTPETLASRVLIEEHKAYPQAIAMVLEQS